jgi:Tfp pilus assembly protein PilO
MADPAETSKQRRLHFDPTINAGHLLTAVVMLVAGFGAWSTLDKRVVVLEEQRKTQEQIDRHQDQTSQQNMQQIRESLVEIKRNVERISDRLDRKGVGQ